jgi:hypothetical protein
MVRPIAVGDLSAMSATSSRKKDSLAKLFGNIWKDTTDLGVYPEGDGLEIGKPIARWDRTFLGDRAFLVFESRRITWGNEFYFDVPCPDCRRKISWMLDLDELEVYGFSDEMKEAIERDGLDAVLYRELPKSGRRVAFKPLLGNDQKRIESATSRGNGEVGEAIILSRLKEIEGASSPGERRKFVKRMHMMDLEFLREEWDEADIYVQDTIEIECQGCGSTPEVGIPVTERFFSARSARRKRGRGSRS